MLFFFFVQISLFIFSFVSRHQSEYIHYNNIIIMELRKNRMWNDIIVHVGHWSRHQ